MYYQVDPTGGKGMVEQVGHAVFLREVIINAKVLWETREKEMMTLGRTGPKQEETIKTELK
jgi:hypothetical protein